MTAASGQRRIPVTLPEVSFSQRRAPATLPEAISPSSAWSAPLLPSAIRLEAKWIWLSHSSVPLSTFL